MGKKKGASYRPNYEANPGSVRPKAKNTRDQSTLVQPDSQGFGHNTDLRQVDSWRSYRDDTANLQTAVGGAVSAFNPSATSFMPINNPASIAASRPYFTPYQPLRVSNGTNEREILLGLGGSPIESTNAMSSAQRHQPSVQSSNSAVQWKHRLRSSAANDSLRPVPSIEPHFATSVGPRQGLASLNRSYRSSTPRRTASPPPVPQAAEIYRKQAELAPTRIPSPKKLLVILDLNGTLLYRPSRAGNPTNIRMRPGVTTFMEYLFENHVVMIYTSARPENATGMISNLLHPKQRNKLVAIWARDKLDLTRAQYNDKVQVYKKLDKVWGDRGIQASAVDGQWDQTNTILVDDSHLKALAQPHNLLQVSEYSRADNPIDGTQEAMAAAAKIQQDILKQLEMKLEELKWQTDVTQLIRLWQNSELPVPSVPGQEVIVEENVDQKRLQEKPYPRPAPVQLLSPKSPSETEREGIVRDDESDAGTRLSDRTVNDLADMIPGLGRLDHSSNRQDTPSAKSVSRSVSPIDESVWQDILGGGVSLEEPNTRSVDDTSASVKQREMTLPQTPESLPE